MHSILMVDDDAHLRQMVTDFLHQHQYKLFEARDGVEALQLLEKESIQLMILDVMMPNLDGYEVMKNIKPYGDIPVIMLTAKGQLHDKEKGFTLGVDDYLVKPFELQELLFRMKALLRRTNKEQRDVIVAGEITVNKISYEVEVGGQTWMLPLKEFELLYVLAANQNKALSRDQLIEKVWGLEYAGNERTVDVHIKRLRERLQKHTEYVHLKTIRGIGYALEVKLP